MSEYISNIELMSGNYKIKDSNSVCTFEKNSIDWNRVNKSTNEYMIKLNNFYGLYYFSEEKITDADITNGEKYLTPAFPFVPEYWGAIGDGVNDDTQPLINCFNYCQSQNLTMVLSKNKKYFVNNLTLTVIKDFTNHIIIDMNSSAIESIGTAITVNSYRQGDILTCNRYYTIQNGSIKSTQVAQLLYTVDLTNATFIQLKNIVISGFMGVKMGSDNNISDSFICSNEDTHENSIGVLVISDNRISNTNIFGFETTLYINGGNNDFIGVHDLKYWYESNPIESIEKYIKTKFAYISNGYSRFSNCYSDGNYCFVETKAEVVDNGFNMINSTCYSYYENIPVNLFILNTIGVYDISNNQFYIPNYSSKQDCISLQQTTDYAWESMFSTNWNIKDNILINPENIKQGDLILSKNKMPLTVSPAKNTNIKNKWLYIGDVMCSFMLDTMIIELCGTTLIYSGTHESNDSGQYLVVYSYMQSCAFDNQYLSVAVGRHINHNNYKTAPLYLKLNTTNDISNFDFNCFSLKNYFIPRYFVDLITSADNLITDITPSDTGKKDFNEKVQVTAIV